MYTERKNRASLAKIFLLYNVYKDQGTFYLGLAKYNLFKLVCSDIKCCKICLNLVNLYS